MLDGGIVSVIVFSVVMRLWCVCVCVCVYLCPCTHMWYLRSCAVGVVCCCVVGCGVHTPQVHSMLQGLMLHIVMQRVTLDCVLLPHLQTAHSHHTHKIRMHVLYCMYVCTKHA